MLKVDVVKTHADNDALAFEAYSEETLKTEKYLLWFDKVDGTLTLSYQFNRVNRKLTTLTISK